MRNWYLNNQIISEEFHTEWFLTFSLDVTAHHCIKENRSTVKEILFTLNQKKRINFELNAGYNTFSDMYVTLEQFASRLIEITTRYNSRYHVSYAPGNLIGRYVKYPAYGDFPETYTLREYGPWWKLSAATYQKPYRYNDVDPLGAEDFVTMYFDHPVIPTKLFVYETYNPGSIVRIWGRLSKHKWELMWEGNPQKCPPEARKFQPEIRKLRCFIDTVRLELNCSELNHHTCFDAILLIGFSGPGSEFQLKCLKALDLPEMNNVTDCTSEDVELRGAESQNYFEKLPYEVIIHIFQFLDLKSLSKCSCVSSEWNRIADDPLLYQNISLKKYWHVVDSKVFDFLQSKCKVLKKLDLSWCGNDDHSFPRKLFQFIRSSCVNLTHISLGNANYFNGSHLAALSRCLKLEELRLRNVFISDLEFCHVETLCQLTKLVTLDLYSTTITIDLLIPLLKVNPNLKYINLDFCDEISSLDDVIEVVAEHNKELVGWSSWKGKRLTARGVRLLGKCHKLEDIDLGWGLNVSAPENSLESLALGCKRLRSGSVEESKPQRDAMTNKRVFSLNGNGWWEILRSKGSRICSLRIIRTSNMRFLCPYRLKIKTHNPSVVRYWFRKNKHLSIPVYTQYPQKINVWTGIRGNYIIGPFFIDGNLNATKYLELLILSGWRPLVDATLLPIIDHCTELEQLDLLSITVSQELIEGALNRLHKLRLLELSFCDSIPLEKVEQWRISYPHVTIQRCIDTD